MRADDVAALQATVTAWERTAKDVCASIVTLQAELHLKGLQLDSMQTYIGQLEAEIAGLKEWRTEAEKRLRSEAAVTPTSIPDPVAE